MEMKPNQMPSFRFFQPTPVFMEIFGHKRVEAFVQTITMNNNEFLFVVPTWDSEDGDDRVHTYLLNPAAVFSLEISSEDQMEGGEEYVQKRKADAQSLVLIQDTRPSSSEDDEDQDEE